ncbi:MAG TPA: hypothetical protein DDZ83_06135 [Nitrospinae bacterium]|nr:hypothetical protein [Nitrospinota bacterium]
MGGEPRPPGPLGEAASLHLEGEKIARQMRSLDGEDAFAARAQIESAEEVRPAVSQVDRGPFCLLDKAPLPEGQGHVSRSGAVVTPRDENFRPPVAVEVSVQRADGLENAIAFCPVGGQEVQAAACYFEDLDL